MPLSKHLYSLNEVQAALSYCSTHRQTSESLFWCQELVQSGCESEAISVLFESWLWQVGPYRLQWLVDTWNALGSNEIQDQSILLSTYQLSSLTQYDNSLSNILVLRLLQTNNPPDRVTFKTPHVLPSQDEKECYFIRALFQGKAQSAWWISSYLAISRIWELLEWYNCHVLIKKEYKICLNALQQYEQLLGYRSDEYDIIIRCMAILMCCLSPSQQHVSFQSLPSCLPSFIIDRLTKWDSITTIPPRRIYSIPTCCLYGDTIRGHYKWSQQNRIQLHQVERYMIGCPFWEEAVTKYGYIDEEKETICWNSEDDMEQFYNNYFPDGIPDEWNKEEKNKSHGDGVLGPTETVTLKNYYSKFLSKQSCLAWYSSPNVHEFLKTIQFEDSFPISIIKLYKRLDDNLEELTMTLLKPVRKLKRIEMNSISSLSGMTRT